MRILQVLCVHVGFVGRRARWPRAPPRLSRHSATRSSPSWSAATSANSAVPVRRKGDLDGDRLRHAHLPDSDYDCLLGQSRSTISQADQAHIHRGPAGVNGGVVVTLSPPVAPGRRRTQALPQAAVRRSVGSNAAIIRADPTSFYVNVHNASFPDGATRGQLH